MNCQKWLNRFQEAHGHRPRALITGGSSGMGLEYAKQLAEIGCNLLLVSNQREELERTAESLRQGRDIQVMPHYQDLATDTAADELLAYCQSQGLQIDILINNAGISREQPFLEMSVETFDEICVANLRSVMLMMKAVLPAMERQKSGSVVNIGSGAALRGLPGSAAYSVSKAGVVALTQAVGDEMRPKGIRVNVICPGPVDTELFQKSERRQFILDAGGDVFDTETVANGILFLASDLSKGMNSQTLVMRGFNRW